MNYYFVFILKKEINQKNYVNLRQYDAKKIFIRLLINLFTD